MNWDSLSEEEINQRIKLALSENSNYDSDLVMGFPGSYLAAENLYFGKNQNSFNGFISSLVANPNHIGCHTLSDAKDAIFGGTHALEKEALAIISEEILGAKKGAYDGFVATGGTEANIQAFWVFRNFFKRKFNLENKDVVLVYSEDSHYSMPKAVNLLGLDSIEVSVHTDTRELNSHDLNSKLTPYLSGKQKKCFILVMNLGTTLFGTMDDISTMTTVFDNLNLEYRCHVDAAFGGFITPFVEEGMEFTFQNPKVDSITIDAHKALGTPYGTGVYIVKKGYIENAKTDQASYVSSHDVTVCGSRSGANAVALWSVLKYYGSVGLQQKIKGLLSVTDWFTEELNALGVEYFRTSSMNIITIRAKYVGTDLAFKYKLQSDNYFETPKWYKIVVMPHITKERLKGFLGDLSKFLKERKGVA